MTVEKYAFNLLYKLGMPIHLSGYLYLKSAIITAIEETNSLQCISKEIYPRIAKQYSVSEESIERSIRGVIAASWKYGCEFVYKRYMNYYSPEHKRPTVKTFLVSAAEWYYMGEDERGAAV